MNPQIPNVKYSGVILGRDPNQRVAGVSSGYEPEILLESGNWDKYRPKHERQNMGYETSACLLFSGEDCVESLFNFYWETERLDEESKQWLEQTGYRENGKFNFSDRLPANYADIIPLTGTYQYKANNAIAKYQIPESRLPYTDKGLYINPDPTKGGYYHREEITEEMLALAEEFEKRFTITWHYVEDRAQALKSSPLQVLVRYADGDGILAPNGTRNHGVMLYKAEPGIDYIDDSYWRQDKRYDPRFVYEPVGWGLTINKYNMDIQHFVTQNDLAWVQNETTGQFARVMQKKLRPIISNDRGALILLDEKVRGNTIIKDGKTTPAKLTPAEWKQLPKEDF